MKSIVCEMCGSHDMIKTNDHYVCQSCGTKFTLEEARKLIVEGVVKIDNTERLDNLFEAARNAKSIGNYEQAKRFYTEILTLEPNSWEATYYSVFCSAADCMIMQIESSANSLRNCLDICFRLIELYAEDKAEAVSSVARDTISIAGVFHDAALEHFDNSFARLPNILLSQWVPEYIGRASAAAYLLFSVGDHAEDQSEELAVAAWHKGLTYIVNYYPILRSESNEKQNTHSDIEKYTEKIQKFVVDYTTPNKDLSALSPNLRENLRRLEKVRSIQRTNADGGSGGCYVATAVYGSYDCPEVWTLRRFRDYTLAATWYGRAFISIYYAISPTIVKWFGHTEWFKTMWKRRLDCMVANLNRTGVENTPYKDKVW